ncbi:MAG: cytochrome c [Steroidobacteraceae bacterium]
MSRNSAAALLGFALTLPLQGLAADESSVVLADGPGREQVQAACSMCHSVDYVVMNSPILDRAGWEKTVNKMVTVFGAPLTSEEVAEIVSYLDSHYGK